MTKKAMVWQAALTAAQTENMNMNKVQWVAAVTPSLKSVSLVRFEKQDVNLNSIVRWGCSKTKNLQGADRMRGLDLPDVWRIARIALIRHDLAWRLWGY